MVLYMKIVDIDFHKLTNIIYIIRIHYLFHIFFWLNYLFHILNIDIDKKYIYNIVHKIMNFVGMKCALTTVKNQLHKI